MDFDQLSKFASLLAKDYARDFFRLLLIYPSISASEAASRLDMHIKTAQDFLDGLESAGIVSKKEVYEKKRPYFRYNLLKKQIKIELDISGSTNLENKNWNFEKQIREKKGAGALFTSSSKPNTLASVTVISGKGRDKKERKINLTENQGKFLFFLPFPTEPAATIKSLFKKAEIKDIFYNEIIDIIDFLNSNEIIECVPAK